MAQYMLVNNSSLCPGQKGAFKTYYDLVDEFVDKMELTGKQAQTITIPNDHAKREGFAVDAKDKTMRLDLQGTDNGYANIQAQFGKGHENCSKGGSYGGVLMCCNVPFTRAEFKEGLKRSFEAKASLCQMDADGYEEVAENVAQSKSLKTKPGKEPWKPGTEY